MLRIVPHTVPRVVRSHEHFPDGFELHLLASLIILTRTTAVRQEEPPPPSSSGFGFRGFGLSVLDRRTHPSPPPPYSLINLKLEICSIGGAGYEVGPQHLCCGT